MSMTVAEMIATLSDLPPDAVMVCGNGGFTAFVEVVEAGYLQLDERGQPSYVSPVNEPRAGCVPCVSVGVA